MSSIVLWQSKDRTVTVEWHKGFAPTVTTCFPGQLQTVRCYHTPKAAIAGGKRKWYRRPKRPDPREPDYSRAGIFVHHNCAYCASGQRPCVRGNPSRCEYPHARND